MSFGRAGAGGNCASSVWTLSPALRPGGSGAAEASRVSNPPCGALSEQVELPMEPKASLVKSPNQIERDKPPTGTPRYLLLLSPTPKPCDSNPRKSQTLEQGGRNAPAVPPVNQ